VKRHGGANDDGDTNPPTRGAQGARSNHQAATLLRVPRLGSRRADSGFPDEDRRAQQSARAPALLVAAAVGDQTDGQMKINPTDNVRLVIEPDGNDSRVVNGIHIPSWILLTQDGAVIEIWEAGGKIYTRTATARDLEERSASQML